MLDKNSEPVEDDDQSFMTLVDASSFVEVDDPDKEKATDYTQDPNSFLAFQRKKMK